LGQDFRCLPRAGLRRHFFLQHFVRAAEVVAILWPLLHSRCGFMRVLLECRGNLLPATRMSTISAPTEGIFTLADE
jgi:hypothetical protein